MKKLDYSFEPRVNYLDVIALFVSLMLTVAVYAMFA